MVVWVPMPHFSPSRPREVSRVNDNYHVLDPIDSQFCSFQGLEFLNQTVNCNVVSHFVTDTGLSQKRDLSPNLKERSIKFVKGICFANYCLSASPILNGRLQKFWQVWLSLGSNSRVVSILQEGYNLPFKMRPLLTRSPLVVSGYANPCKNNCLKEAFQSLLQKKVVEKVVVQSSLAFYNWLFLVPNPKTGGGLS